ncbi:MAG: chromosome segregation protein SMC [Lysobacteraceae bacterium]
MRLSAIKLAGFKSFVDPTVLHLPSNMTAVVGPNGCGKSNIIDAVRWVMGESSASRLRGDHLTDVIFSGSATRKPISQATVELLFDNSDGAVGGEFARFNEISVKRLVSRDGQSAYFLNGTRCRRRDITDLFLGTGLGPRSYSIIEQGMISQIIEARPEDLRVFLEEAAGISKYKERRKETETRIRHTRENLDRLNDVRQEVDKQLEHLKRQARQAELYQQHKAEQREKDAQLKALEYRGIDLELGQRREALRGGELELESLVSEQRSAEAQIETCRVQQGEAQTRLNLAQAESYRVGGEIARLEQQISHQRELGQRLQRNRQESGDALTDLDGHLRGDEEQAQTLREALEEAQPGLEDLLESEQARLDALRDAEAALVDWQAEWDGHARTHAEVGRNADVGRARIELLERQMLDAGRRQEALLAERGGLDVEALELAVQATEEEHERQRAALDTHGEALEARKQALATLQDAQRAAQGELADCRKSTQEVRGRLASLEALQHAALGQEKGSGVDWLRQRGLDGAPRLGELLEVQAGWENAVEIVLGSLLEAVAIDAPQDWLDAASALREGRLALVAAATDNLDAPPGSLAARVAGPAAVRRLLVDVDAFDSLAEAQQRLAADSGRPGITRDGEWVGPGWLRLLRSGEAQQGALARERDIHALREEIERLAQHEAELNARLAELRSQMLEAEQHREDAQRSLYLAHRSASELGGQLQSQQGKLESAQARSQRIDAELSQLGEDSQRAQEGVREARAHLETAITRMAELEAQRQRLESARQGLIDARDHARAAARQARDSGHQLALQVASQKARLTSLTQSVERMRQQRQQLEQRLAELDAQLAEGDAPIQALQATRQTALEQRVIAEKDLATARSALEGVDAELRRHEQFRQQAEHKATALRERLQRLRLEEQAQSLRAQALLDAIIEQQLVPDEIIAGLPEGATPEAWRQALAELESRIRRLEPVNLAAIQEYGEQAQRKEYLDAQHTDLTTALETLEDAIRKIDRETRGRFKDTFDRVNAGVQEIYPRLFGGGHAYLELTGEDLLDTGVAIMARPPGKRVSNISLLSGGEKAMTAVALVFAIFRLNPAPFCLLDEVDAPLDEANVGRFSTMVREMSEKVQFLFVTHNKATMEAASQLAGVTMREPGVSRLVTVDLAEAARLAGAA